MSDVIKLKNDKINTDTYVDLQSASFKSTCKRNNKADPIVGQDPVATTDGSMEIALGDQVSMENAIYTIVGVINVEDFTSNTTLHAHTGITVITLGYLKQLARVRLDSVTYIQIWFGADSNKSWKNYLGTGTGGSDSIKVMVDAIDFTPMENSEGLHIIKYNLTLREVR